ncbi:Nn.00g096850.m01.CDS01 [Neocucurbitaria sp. VM-36]
MDRVAIKRERNVKEEDAIDDGGITLAMSDQGPGFYEFYAVAVGRTPGLYSHWEEARKQVDGYKGCKHAKFMHRSEALQYMRTNGIPDAKIRLFRKTFKPTPSFIPNPTASFNDEFRDYAATQDWKPDEARKAKIATMFDELVYHYLPEGIAPDQEDEVGNVDLTDEQTLKIYQGMCRSADKVIYPTIDNCLLELKRAPYVNIIDFVNTFRTGQIVQTFRNWNKFQEYTFGGHRIDIKYAKENEFLAPLLQDFRKGPGAVCPIKVRRDFVASKAKKIREHKKNAPTLELKISSSIPELCLSPPASDFSPPTSRSPSPDLDIPRSPSSHTDSVSDDPQVKLEPQSPMPAPPPKFALAVDATQEDESLHFPLMEAPPLSSQLEERYMYEPPPSSQMEERHWTPMASLRKRPCASLPTAATPCKRSRRIGLES